VRVSKHIIAKPLTNNHFLVDAAGIGGRNVPLPGEISTVTCSGCEVSRGHSTDRDNEPIKTIGGLTRKGRAEH
jgi:hypothetical protein